MLFYSPSFPCIHQDWLRKYINLEPRPSRGMAVVSVTSSALRMEMMAFQGTLEGEPTTGTPWRSVLISVSLTHIPCESYDVEFDFSSGCSAVAW